MTGTYAVLYNATGTIVQRMSGGAANIAATAQLLGLSLLTVPGDAASNGTFMW